MSVVDIPKVKVGMTVNGRAVSAEVEPRTLLIHYLREHLNLTGPHIGCDTSHCGACTVDVDGRSVKSCTMFAVQAEGANVIRSKAWPPSTERCTRSRRASARCTGFSAASARRA